MEVDGACIVCFYVLKVQKKIQVLRRRLLRAGN